MLPIPSAYYIKKINPPDQIITPFSKKQSK